MNETEPELTRVLRDGLIESEASLGDIAKACLTTHGQLSRFVRRERALSLPTAGRLFDYLGLKIVRPKQAKGKLTK